MSRNFGSGFVCFTQANKVVTRDDAASIYAYDLLFYNNAGTMKTLFHYMLALGMLITGSLNTITTKAADKVNTLDRYGDTVNFNHPFFQALCMFVGEGLCLLVFNLLRMRAKMTGSRFEEAKPHSKFILWLPALCDMTATSLMYVGLSLTDASIFQMLRGSVVIFTGILSKLVLKRDLGLHRWIAMALVMGGTAIVGTASLPAICGGGDSGATDQSKATLGNILIIVAQVVVAVQMIVEELFISKYDIPPLQVVGWEGTFGFLTLSVVLGIMYGVPAPAAFCSNPPHCNHFEDTYDAFVNLANSWQLALALGGNILSIAFFNAIGVSITKHLNAATRMVLDSLRTLVIWCFSMGVGWESFCWAQPVGFVVLLLGILLFNEIIRIPGLKYKDEDAKKEVDEEAAESDKYALLNGMRDD